ncbi:MAG: hypothetical protein E7260_08950 [Lachnospiraceae bacterium]|nr:hypothetical protein [Lachnospiraceae bacterium]
MKLTRCLMLTLCVIASVKMTSCSATKTIDSISYIELGIPTSERYSDGVSARSPWDMAIYDNKLYIGSGDYDTNAGPVDMWCYDMYKNTWSNSGTLSEEEIDRFCVVNNRLVVPGIDPQEDWTLGNYYVLDGNQWVKKRNIEGGLHTFDIIEFDGMIFGGLGVLRGSYPVVYSKDNGETFENVVFYKDDEKLDTTGSEKVRVYDLFVMKDKLYAVFMYGDTEVTYDLYRYENGKFVYDNQWYGKIHQIKFTNNIITGKTQFKDNMFFTTGYLYATEDMTNFTRMIFPNEQVVYDICTDENYLYALCANKQDDGKYKVSVYRNDGQAITNFYEIFNFVYDVPPLSIVCQKENFYIGMGDTSNIHDNNGMILCVEYSKMGE